MNRWVFLAVAAAFLAATFAGCETDGAANGDLVLSVTVRPGEVTVEMDEMRRFEAEVYATGNASGNVVWTVGGNASAGTNIDETGLLRVAANETSEQLTVTARSVFDDRRYGTATVLVVPASEPPVTVAVNPGTIMAEGMTAIDFQAIVSVGGPVDWSVSENTSLGTHISHVSYDTLSATLTIATDEDGDPIIVTATSREHPDRYAQAMVLFTAPPPLERMWVVGDMHDGADGWLLPGLPMLPQSSGVFTWGGALGRDTRFRFNPEGAFSWYGATWYAPVENNTVVNLGGTVPMQTVGGNNWIIPRAGWYTITVDRNEMELRVERTGSPTSDLDIWLVGLEFPWTLPGIRMTREDGDTFSWMGEVPANANFRFSRIERAAEGWSAADWFASTGTSGAPAPLNADVPMSVSGESNWSIVEAGWYEITVNPDTLTMRVVSLEPPLEALWLVGAMGGWDSAGIPMTREADGVFVWEGAVPGNANFRFSRTQRGSDDWNSGTWFGTPPGTPNNFPVVLGGTVPISVFSGGGASSSNWMIPTSGGQYRITVDQFAMTLRVEPR